MIAVSKDSGEKRELIAFRMAKQEFCIDIRTVREIRGYVAATPLPKTPNYVVGVINLRGTVLPVIDLGLRMGLKAIEPTARSVIMVVKLGPQLFGLLVDAVSDILSVTEDLIQPNPDISNDRARSFVTGMMAIDDRMIAIIEATNIHPQALELAA
ncbi:chemotaxis protein CheW [Fulvimarina sp. 2208YS6-2-32]|uniref:Chemotaxis protein CheW n=1 Tax=Fulvimarina uroteuthidis TaxID=3098149 RepID=A0ABU5HXK7_9HYPH|nr:chemotaxis protein CheW [Fulvimarina sp. 2208YS6-2-32]MDY8107780.1 chemotaxis protein CheW [Fulvimarina sp. 2208YS6-2-32]